MSTIYTKKEVEKHSPDLQLKFYKEQFESSHCQNCSNELYWDWVIYDDGRFCERCFEAIKEEEIAHATQEIREMEDRIEKLKKKFDL